MLRRKAVGVVTGTIVVFTGLTVAGGRLNDSGWLLRSRTVGSDKLTSLAAGHASGSYTPEPGAVKTLDRVSTRKNDLTPLSSDPLPPLPAHHDDADAGKQDHGRDGDHDADDRGAGPHDRLGSSGPHQFVGGAGFVGGGVGFGGGGGSKPGRGAPASTSASVSSNSTVSGGSSSGTSSSGG